MKILSQDVASATEKKFSEELQEPVQIIHFTQEPSRLIVPDFLKGQECMFCREAKGLLKDIGSLSTKIELVLYDFVADKDKAAEFGIDKIPATVLKRKKSHNIRFFGIPSGYEYTSLIEAIIDLSRAKTSLNPKTIEALQTLDKNVHIQVFVTPTCPYCPMAVRLGHQFAMESSQVIADMIEATEFPQLSQKYNVSGVPKTIINETVTIDGAVPEEMFLEQVLKAVHPEMVKT